MKKRYLLFSIIPILFHIGCFPFYFLEGKAYAYGTMSWIQWAANIIVIPIYLVIINYRILSSVFPEALKRLVMMGTIIMGGAFAIVLSIIICHGEIDKLGWGIIIFQLAISIVLLIFEWGIAVLIKTIRKKIY